MYKPIPLLVRSQAEVKHYFISFVSMGKVVLHNNPDPERNSLERAKAFSLLPAEEQLKRLFALYELSVVLNGGKPLKEPQGKGIIIRKLLR